MEIDSPENMMRHIRFLKNEVERLKKSLRTTELQRKWPLIRVAGLDLQSVLAASHQAGRTTADV